MAELPFTLMHPKPEDNGADRPSSSTGSHKSETAASSAAAAPNAPAGSKENGEDVLVDTNLIQLDT